MQDLVLFRFGSTGVLECVKKAFIVLDVIPVFPVRNIANFTSSRYENQPLIQVEEGYLVFFGTAI